MDAIDMELQHHFPFELVLIIRQYKPPTTDLHIAVEKLFSQMYAHYFGTSLVMGRDLQHADHRDLEALYLPWLKHWVKIDDCGNLAFLPRRHERTYRFWRDVGHEIERSDSLFYEDRIIQGKVVPRCSPDYRLADVRRREYVQQWGSEEEYQAAAMRYPMGDRLCGNVFDHVLMPKMCRLTSNNIRTYFPEKVFLFEFQEIKNKWRGTLLDAPCGNTQFWSYTNGECEIVLVRSGYHNRVSLRRINSEEMKEEVTLSSPEDLWSLLDGWAQKATGSFVDFPLETHLRSLSAKHFN
jgi:hypothetical protein